MLFTTVFSFGCSSPRWGLRAELWRLNSLSFLQLCFVYTAMQRKPALTPEITCVNISAVTLWAILGRQSCGKTLTFLVYLVLNRCPDPVWQWLSPSVPAAPLYTTSKSSLHEHRRCELWHLRLVYNLTKFNSGGHRGDGLDSSEVERVMWPFIFVLWLLWTSQASNPDRLRCGFWFH